MSFVMRSVLIALAVACLGGCSQWQYNLGSSLSDINLPSADKQTDVGDVLSLLGPPQRLSAEPTGYVLAWEHWEIRENAVGFSLGPFGAEFMSVDWARVYSRGEFLLASFNQQHQLTAITFADWDNQLGDGQALQPLGFVDVATTSDLRRDLPQHLWGGALLKELPTGLNRQSDPTTGQQGLEQRATPQAIGQRTLSMP